MDFFSEGAGPRCAAQDVDREWWIDHDTKTVELPEGITQETWDQMGKLERARARRQQAEYTLGTQREDQMRAKLLCMECPLLMACRKAGWQEGSHVWGALDGGERYRILKSGQVATVLRRTSGNYVGKGGHDAVWMFKEGASIQEVADELGLTYSRVRDVLRETLVLARVEREEQEGWRSQRELPTLPGQVTGRESYRNGQAVWSLSERESA